MRIFVILCLIAVCVSARQRKTTIDPFADFAGEPDLNLITEDDDRPPIIYTGDNMKAQITNQKNSNHGMGKFNYNFETQNGINIAQIGKLKDEKTFVVSGSYSYTGADGQRYRVKYTADEFGYHPITELDDSELPEIVAPLITSKPNIILNPLLSSRFGSGLNNNLNSNKNGKENGINGVNGQNQFNGLAGNGNGQNRGKSGGYQLIGIKMNEDRGGKSIQDILGNDEFEVNRFNVNNDDIVYNLNMYGASKPNQPDNVVVSRLYLPVEQQSAQKPHTPNHTYLPPKPSPTLSVTQRATTRVTVPIRVTSKPTVRATQPRNTYLPPRPSTTATTRATQRPTQGPSIPIIDLGGDGISDQRVTLKPSTPAPPKPPARTTSSKPINTYLPPKPSTTTQRIITTTKVTTKPNISIIQFGGNAISNQRVTVRPATQTSPSKNTYLPPKPVATTKRATPKPFDFGSDGISDQRVKIKPSTPASPKPPVQYTSPRPTARVTQARNTYLPPSPSSTTTRAAPRSTSTTAPRSTQGPSIPIIDLGSDGISDQRVELKPTTPAPPKPPARKTESRPNSTYLPPKLSTTQRTPAPSTSTTRQPTTTRQQTQRVPFSASSYLPPTAQLSARTTSQSVKFTTPKSASTTKRIVPTRVTLPSTTESDELDLDLSLQHNGLTLLIPSRKKAVQESRKYLPPSS